MSFNAAMIAVLTFIWLLTNTSRSDDPKRVGETPDGPVVASTGQILRPAGDELEMNGRPVDLIVSPAGDAVFVKDNRGLVIIDPGSWKVRQELKSDHGGGSLHGIAIAGDGRSVYLTTSASELLEAKPGPDGNYSWTKSITLAGPGGKSKSFPCGIALSPDGARAFICLSRNNSVAVVDLVAGKLEREIEVGVAPYDIVLIDGGETAFISCWGGRRAKDGERIANSSGTPALADERGVASSGTVAAVRTKDGAAVWQTETGLQPNDLVVSPDGKRVYVANGNSDTVAILDAATGAVVERISIRPDAALPFGSMPSALALSADGRTLYVANGGNNAVAVVDLSGDSSGDARLRGFVPTGWYPGALAIHANEMFIANVKGRGSRWMTDRAKKNEWNVYGHRGTVTRAQLPDGAALAKMTQMVREDALVPQILRANEKAAAASDVKAVPVPARIGEPSTIEHVVYVIKENRTYDQVFGDIGRGNSEPKLCIFGRDITPNHHALADEFVLLDNYYCGGVLSADGHSWATEGNVTAYLEKAFGGFSRSYTFGDDPLTYSASGFIWDAVLARGLSFRNYGEMNYSDEKPDTSYSAIYEDFVNGRLNVTFDFKIGVENLRRYSCPEYPGWNMDIPDVLRADVFLNELKQFDDPAAGKMLPNLVIVYLPNDHTSGTTPDDPTPRSYLADNDVALGRIVEALSKSRYWSNMALFVNEDDPQDGFDHVDGHRSLCLVISPYAKRGAVVSHFYNQSSVLHTICQIFGCPPLNQLTAAAPLMTECFTQSPDLRPYICRPNLTPLNELNPKKSAMREGVGMELAAKSESLDFSKPDVIHDDTLNRILWHAMRGGDAEYPAAFAGAHGKGLKELGLKRADLGGREEDGDEGVDEE